jgi:hypothetical protein
LVSGAVPLVFVLLELVLRTLSLTDKQKALIQLKNKETELQKKIIEEKNQAHWTAFLMLKGYSALVANRKIY